MKPNNNTKNSQALRQRRTEAGEKEMRGVWMTAEEEKIIKPKTRAMVKRMRG